PPRSCAGAAPADVGRGRQLRTTGDRPGCWLVLLFDNSFSRKEQSLCEAAKQLSDHPTVGRIALDGKTRRLPLREVAGRPTASFTQDGPNRPQWGQTRRAAAGEHAVLMWRELGYSVRAGAAAVTPRERRHMSNFCPGPKPGLFFDLRQVWRGISRMLSKNCKDQI